jgi:hypothetical protein
MDSTLASKRRMGLIAAGAVVLLGLGAAIVFSRPRAEAEGTSQPVSKKGGRVLDPSSHPADEPGSRLSAFLALGRNLPAGSSREGFVSVGVDGRYVAQMTTNGKIGFRLAAAPARYGVSSIARLSGVKAMALTPTLDGNSLSPWQLGEGWALHASLVDGASLAKLEAHELLFAPKDGPTGAVVQIESVSIAPVTDRASFDVGPESDGHWIDGFHRRERDAIWSRGLTSAIGVVLEPRKVPYRLKVRGRTLSGLGSIPVKARVNGRDVGSAEVMSKVDDVTWPIPSDSLLNGSNRIELEYSRTGKPTSFNPNSRDARDLAFRISSFELAPAD